MAVYALGNIGDERRDSQLEAALSDPDRDVSWNAAVALAQLGDGAGEVQLLQMLDRDFLGTLQGMDESQRLLAIESAIQASALVGTEPLLDEAPRARRGGPSPGNSPRRRRSAFPARGTGLGARPLRPDSSVAAGEMPSHRWLLEPTDLAFPLVTES